MNIRDQDLVLRCGVCQMPFWTKYDLPMPLKAFKVLRVCPHCGLRDSVKQPIMVLYGEERIKAIEELKAEA